MQEMSEKRRKTAALAASVAALGGVIPVLILMMRGRGRIWWMWVSLGFLTAVTVGVIVKLAALIREEE